jgi:hypothetical protein
VLHKITSNICQCFVKDVLTDLKADAEILPVEPMKEDWLAHKVTMLVKTFVIHY